MTLAPPAKGSRRVWLRVDGVVPFLVPVVGVEWDGGEFGVGDLDAFLVGGGVVDGLDGESGCCCGRGDEVDDGP